MKQRQRRRRTAAAALGLAVALAGGLAGAAGAEAPEAAIQAEREIPEDTLLDVGIQLFDPGLPALRDDEDEDDLAKQGIFPEVRRSEARYVPVRLMETLQATGQWGAVRVVPKASDGVDLLLTGRILESSGKKLELEVRAVDATRREWLSRKYKAEADVRAYRDDDGLYARQPFQSLYNEVANDLVAVRDKRDAEELRQIRQVSWLRFAGDLSPDPFAGYLGVDRKGRYEVARLPADGDPMVERIARIRERDQLLVDTIHTHYADFAAQLADSYTSWQRYSYEELEAKQELRKAAWTRKILGAVAILGAVLIEGDGRGSGTARDAAVIGGIVAIQSGIGKAQEAKLHAEALRELGTSFEAEVSPLLVEVEGQTLRLTGTAETQYVTWRELLRQMFQNETGLPVDPDAAPDAAAAAAPPAEP